MKGQTPYPPGFLLAIADISGGVCEKCGGIQGIGTHHIWGRGGMGKTIHRLWNCIALCEEHHEPGKWADKVVLFDLRLRRLMNYCQVWGKRPSNDWKRLESGVIGQKDFDNLRQQLKEEKIEGVTYEKTL